LRLLVLGSNGQVGFELGRARLPAGMTVTGIDRDRIDITDRKAVFAAVPGHDLVVNVAAYTAVDRAEGERDAAFAANAEAPGYIAEACRNEGAALIHFSTDYVFDGVKAGPYIEDDPVNPLGVYGESKEAGERAVRAALAEHVILRTAWVYGVHGHNFVKTMLRLADERRTLRVVADQRGSPTAAADLAAAILRIATAPTKRWGTFHFTGGGETTWHGFAEAIVGGRVPVEPIATADYPTPARRPANSVLDCGKIAAAYGIVGRPWQVALGEVLGQTRGS